MADDFAFDEAPNTAVVVCERVSKGESPVLVVSHSTDGDWQFVCDGDHSDGGGEKVLLVGLSRVVEQDKSLNELADLCMGWTAERTAPGAPWSRVDEAEEDIRRDVAESGCSIIMIPAGDEHEPAFAYSIGLLKNYGHPEIVVAGLQLEVMHALINLCRDAIREGKRFEDGSTSSELLERYTCTFKAVPREPRVYREFGYAAWFYDTRDFPVLQCFWPDEQGRFPWLAGCDARVIELQRFAG